ncbi:MAG: acyl--CoA ligase [Deltaproteobacteria bacterium]|nr:acyl--CoA ligase [Deltaproteobacteria bacterium]
MLFYDWLTSAVKVKGSAKALIYRDTYLSWRGLLHRVNRRSEEFAQMGVGSGDLVGLMLGNVPDFVILSLALSKLNAAPVPLDPTTSVRELDMLMSIIPLRGLITRPRGGDAPLPTAQPGQEGTRHRAPETRRRLQGTLLSCSIYPASESINVGQEANNVAAVLVTTDSAGDPKPVERTVDNLRAEAKHLHELLKITADDRALLTVPLFHAFGFDLGFVGCFSAKAALYLEDEIAPARIIKLVREQKITILPGNHSMFAEVGQLPASRPLAHQPRLLSLGGGLTGSALEGFKKRYGVRPLSCFHTTETGTIAVDLKGQAGETVGKALPGIEVRVTNAKTGKPTSNGRKGVLWIRSPSVSPLILGNRGQATPDGIAVGHVDDEGWFRTGDLASVDRAHRLTLRGREDDLVRLEGKQVALGEVEGCIESFPKVTAAQAELITDPLGGPMVIARVVLRPSRGKKIEPEAIIDHCARNLAPYKVPRRIEFCESL